MRRILGFLIGIFVGGLVGATTALLLAPESGEQLRGELRARGQNFITDIQNAAKLRRAEMEKQLAQLRAPHQ
jgi:gas vesicle protein